MERLNITIPEEIIEKIKDIPDKNFFILAAIKEKIDRIEKLDELLVEGYKATCKEDSKANSEWEDVTLEDWK